VCSQTDLLVMCSSFDGNEIIPAARSQINTLFSVNNSVLLVTSFSSPQLLINSLTDLSVVEMKQYALKLLVS
jgi:hypothetical protein